MTDINKSASGPMLHLFLGSEWVSEGSRVRVSPLGRPETDTNTSNQHSQPSNNYTASNKVAEKELIKNNMSTSLKIISFTTPTSILIGLINLFCLLSINYVELKYWYI